MRKSCAFWFVIVTVILGQFTGCASQSNKAPETPSMVAASKPDDEKTPADTPETSLTAEEEALFDDDEDEWETQEDQDVILVADPIEPFNRAMFSFNLKLYDWVLRPISLGYRKVTPELVRVGVRNFFTNLSTPVRFTNCLLQGKGKAATAELSKFIFNSTFGVLGFGDLFTDYPEMYPDTEDLGQTFGNYGIGDGFYIVWPVIGSSTLRDSIGKAGDSFLAPLTYVDPSEVNLAAQGVDMVNSISFRIEDIDAARKATFDPYEAGRNFYIQNRRSKIKK
jgi:phospholipid-binding lipoprotein MlaA